jgi:hypothetical protein
MRSVRDAVMPQERLAQWMLDVGTPPAQVFELLTSTAGIAGGARVGRSLSVAEAELPVIRRRRTRVQVRAAS